MIFGRDTVDRATIRQRKTRRPVKFELSACLPTKAVRLDPLPHVRDTTWRPGRRRSCSATALTRANACGSDLLNECRRIHGTAKANIAVDGQKKSDVPFWASVSTNSRPRCASTGARCYCYSRPVCARDPRSGTARTYLNLCWSELSCRPAASGSLRARFGAPRLPVVRASHAPPDPAPPEAPRRPFLRGVWTRTALSPAAARPAGQKLTIQRTGRQVRRHQGGVNIGRDRRSKAS
jgi:hypothetical protein